MVGFCTSSSMAFSCGRCENAISSDHRTTILATTIILKLGCFQQLDIVTGVMFDNLWPFVSN